MKRDKNLFKSYFLCWGDRTQGQVSLSSSPVAFVATASLGCGLVPTTGHLSLIMEERAWGQLCEGAVLMAGWDGKWGTIASDGEGVGAKDLQPILGGGAAFRVRQGLTWGPRGWKPWGNWKWTDHSFLRLTSFWLVSFRNLSVFIDDVFWVGSFGFVVS